MIQVIIGIITVLLVLLPMTLATIYVIKEERAWKRGE